MDFFEQQDQARKKTKWLVLYFGLGIAGTIVATYSVIAATRFYIVSSDYDLQRQLPVSLFDLELFLPTAAVVGLLILLASGYKMLQLQGGGRVVAQELGGREIAHGSRDRHERRLLNVVEEMSIASGVPVPSVYVMDGEDGINAFAAGRTTSDAVIGVTRGCMQKLTRDELQGVIAHEFSHILNGDMRLNMRLMGWLFGILFIALIGEMCFRLALRARWIGNDRSGAAAALVMLAAGAGVWLVGSLGGFFANLIKAAVSREREYLADASAVQFTRNPDGIGGALLRIGGHKRGSQVGAPMARDASHLFFGAAFQGPSLLPTLPCPYG